LEGRDVSRSQIDRLGERLTAGNLTDDDLILLDTFRRSYSSGYEEVIALIRGRLGFEPTGRPAKSTGAITEKLRRETIRLSQIQDIAGCRFIVLDASSQERAVAELVAAFPGAEVDDRRERPSHGYRAVHVIATCQGKPIEIQVRTVLQHSWAELSEKYADIVYPGIKYGEGPEPVLEVLSNFSGLVREFEHVELNPPSDRADQIEGVRERVRALLHKAMDDVLEAQRRGDL
jgi:putative GTP pyrophosphokinase